MLTNPPVPYDLCVGKTISHLLALLRAISVIVNLRFKLYLWPEVRARAQAALLLLGARTLD